MPKIHPLTHDELSSLLAYDPNTGIFTWKVDIAKNVKAGAVAGCAKGSRFSKQLGKEIRYVYIRAKNFEVPAARVAWLLHYGHWPVGNVLFADGDTENLRISNLREGYRSIVTTGANGLKTRKMTRNAMRHYGLKSKYGLTIETYNVMLTAQNGVCAICKNAETGKNANGDIKPFSVDHNHITGEIRGLLCTQCNYMIGHCRESREVLLAGVAYLDKHAGREATAPVLTIVPTEEQK